MKTPEERLNLHLSRSNSGINTKLYLNMRMYGRDNYSVEPLELGVTEDKLSERERFWIEELGTYTNGLNGNKGEERNREVQEYNVELIKQVEDYLNKEENRYRIFGSKDISTNLGIPRDQVRRVVKVLYNKGRVSTEFIKGSMGRYGYILPYSGVDDTVMNMSKLKMFVDSVRGKLSVNDIITKTGIKREIVINMLRRKRHYKLLLVYISEEELNNALEYYGYKLVEKRNEDWYKERGLRTKIVRDLWLNTYYTRDEIKELTGENTNYIGKVVKQLEGKVRDEVIRGRDLVEFNNRLRTDYDVKGEKYTELLRDIENTGLTLKYIAENHNLDYERFRGVLRTAWSQNSIKEVRVRKQKG